MILKESFENPLQRILPLAYEAITNHEARAVLKDWMIEHVPAHFDTTVWAAGAVGWLLWRHDAHTALRDQDVGSVPRGDRRKREASHSGHALGALWRRPAFSLP